MGGGQQVESKSNNCTQRRKRGAQVSLNTYDDILCFLQDFKVLVCKEHHTAVVHLGTHLLQHHKLLLQLENRSLSALGISHWSI
jgi:hypothetical protein